MKATRWSFLLTAGVMAGSVLLVPAAARASEEGRRNTALVLGAAAAYLLATKKDKVPGLIAAGGAALAYKSYDDAIRARKNRERYWGYYDDDRYYRSRRYDGDRYYRSRRSYDDDGRRYYRTSYRSSPPGWSKGRKKGWQKHSRNCDD